MTPGDVRVLLAYVALWLAALVVERYLTRAHHGRRLW
jgi:hypothetical protein